MLCCAGLFAGAMVGAYLGVPWAPFLMMSLGAAGGLMADIKIFRAVEKRIKSEKQQSTVDQPCYALLSLQKKRSLKADENYVRT